jgi:methylenetetrahydrofolate dehydrogenase (NADP+)/methenyltetrahydrofolate cyclohydrolase
MPSAQKNVMKENLPHPRSKLVSVNLLDGQAIATEVQEHLSDRARNLSAKGIIPGLAAVLVGDDPASGLYVGNKSRAANNIGVHANTHKMSANVSTAELLATVENLNRDNDIHGIIVQLPLPPHINPDEVASTISPTKDVDGAHPISMGKLARGEEAFVPPTALGIVEILERSNIKYDDCHVVICGRSNLVGRPLSLLLQRKVTGGNATVTICHSKTVGLGNYTRQADILITAMGQPNLVTKDMVKEGAIVIDVGTNRIPDPKKKQGYRFVGDVDFDNVSKIASAITPVPGGVGPMTVTMLLWNTVLATERSHN